MKRGNKLWLILLASFLLFLSGCGAEAGKDANTGGKTKKTLRVVTDAAYSPFEFQKEGKVVGFDVDIVKAVAKEAGYKVDIVHIGWDPIFVEIKDKTADIGMSSITINDDRKQSYDFSVPYFLSTNKILVPKGSDIKKADDLKGKTVAVQAATTGQFAVEKVVGKNNKDIKKFETTVLAILEMKKGGAEAVVADNGVIEEYVKNNPKDKFTVIEDTNTFENEYYGLMFAKGSEIRKDIDDAMNKIFDNGTYTKIYKKWFGTEPDLETLKAQQKN